MTETVLSLERTSDAPREARGRVRDLHHLIGRDRVEDATLLVSELVTNAVERGSTRVWFELHG
jgi:anti-sigma regulatory factor (Ser/Thr protein kinase)